MGLIPQYSTRTIPKKIYKLKKAKESGAKFYTDLSDSENCEMIGESSECLVGEQAVPDKVEENADGKSVENNLEKIVSDLVMQHEEFSKVMNRPRRGARSSEPEVASWHEESRPKMPSKADSLPRFFQLNDQIDGDNGNQQERRVLDESLKENPDIDEQHEK